MEQSVGTTTGVGTGAITSGVDATTGVGVQKIYSPHAAFAFAKASCVIAIYWSTGILIEQSVGTTIAAGAGTGVTTSGVGTGVGAGIGAATGAATGAGVGSGTGTGAGGGAISWRTGLDSTDVTAKS